MLECKYEKTILVELYAGAAMVLVLESHQDATNLTRIVFHYVFYLITLSAFFLIVKYSNSRVIKLSLFLHY